ncbi:MAG: hypothetical protein ABEK03_04880 [Candidatus Bipolaricaulia bacterium]
MSPAAVAFQELIRSLTVRSWGLAALAILLTALTVAAMVVVSVIADPATSTVQTQMYAVPDPGLSQERIGELYETLRADPDVAQAHYRFGPPPTAPDSDRDGHFVLTLDAGADADATLQRLQGWDEIRAVQQPERSPNAARVWLSHNGPLVGLALAALIVLAIGCLYGALREARTDFEGPIDLLQMAGAPPSTLRIPFILLGAFYGMFLVLAILALTLAAPLFRGDEALKVLAPTLNAPMATFGLRGLVLGLAFGLVFSGIGGLSAPVQRYPKPLSRSRISASSSGVKAPSPGESSAEAPSDASAS